MSPNIVNQSDCLHSLRSLREENSKCDAVLSMMTDYFIKLSRLESQSADVTIKDVVRSDNKEIIHLLEAFIKLGKSAEEDLHQIQKYKENREIYNSPVDEEIYYGVTGVNLRAQQETTRQYVPEDLFGYNKESLPQDPYQSAFKVNALLAECERLLVKLTGGPNQCDKDAETLHHLVIKEKGLMIELRRVLALTYYGFHAPLNSKKELHSRVNSLFKNTYGWLRGRTYDVGDEWKQIIQCAWVWESGPPLCLLAGSILEKMSVRIYGLSSVDLDKVKMFITSDGEFKQQDIDQKEIWPSKSEDPNDGIVLDTPKISLKNLKGNRKRRSDPKLYRVALSLNVLLHTSTVDATADVECTSLPFVVRTGSPQLWPYTAHIVWYLWTQHDMRKPDKLCPREVSLSSIVSLIQARLFGSGLQPLDYQLSLDTREEPMEQGNSGICVQDRMLRRLTDGERDGWEEVLKQWYGPGTREKEIVSRENFTKTLKQKEGKEICPWALICGAVKTALKLQKFDIDKYFYIGLSNDQCKSLTQVKDGEFIFRSSLSLIRLNCSTSKEPLTSVVFEVCSGGQMRPVVASVDDLESYSLKDVVRKISLNKRDNTCVQWILPSKRHVFSIVEKERPGEFKGKGYTGIEQKQFAPETVIRHSKTPLAPSSERRSIQQEVHACEAENGVEPAMKKCAISKHGGSEGTSVGEHLGNPDIATCFNNHNLTDPLINQNVIEPHDNDDLLEPHNETTDVLTADVCLDGPDTTQSSEISKENGSDRCDPDSVKDNAYVDFENFPFDWSLFEL